MSSADDGGSGGDGIAAFRLVANDNAVNVGAE